MANSIFVKDYKLKLAALIYTVPNVPKILTEVLRLETPLNLHIFLFGTNSVQQI